MNEPAQHSPATLASRRAFLRNGSLTLVSAAFGAELVGCSALRTDTRTRQSQRIGLVADVHYADRDPAGTRYYRRSLEKMNAAAASLGWARPHMTVQLGDLIDSGDSPQDEIEHARRVHAALAALDCPLHHVLGNHDLGGLSKDEFLGVIGKGGSWYSTPARNVRLIMLDACFRADGTPYERGNFDWRDTAIPPRQLEWLAAELAATTGPAIVFTHQRLDDTKFHSVQNAAAVRSVLEDAGNVLAVFQGHSHRNAYAEVNGIHYVVLRAMVEEPALADNAYALLHVYADGSLRLDGFGHQKSRALPTG